MSSEHHTISPLAWERMVTAVEKVRDRMRRAASALSAAGVPYAIAGDNAVAAWVGEVDEAAMRNASDVDILLRRADLERAKAALAAAGFVYRHSAGIDMFLDGEGAKAREAVHVVFANEKVRAQYSQPAPDVDDSTTSSVGSVLSLNAVVRMKLTSFRDKDRMHLRDLIDVGLIDRSWLSRVPPELAPRLRELLDNPES